jgi:hypothetical protein
MASRVGLGASACDGENGMETYDIPAFLRKQAD